MSKDAPWLKHYGEVPKSIEYPDCTMVEAVMKTAKIHPELTAYSFLGRKRSYSGLVSDIERVARAFKALGIKPGERVMIYLPNIPQAVECIYALNLIGAVAVMVHPLSSEGETAFFIKNSKCRAVVALDQFYGKFAAISSEVRPEFLILTGVKDALGPIKRVGFALTEGRKIEKVPKSAPVIFWKDFLKGADPAIDPREERDARDCAVILYSGGTTGTMKGILLSNLNFNALALQTIAMGNCVSAGDKMLTVMPIFHGFGLGICVHTALVAGCHCILVPRFNVKSYAGLIRKQRPNCIAGVPTLFEALLKGEDLKGADLSCLKGVFSGGDSLSVELKKKFDAFLKENGAKVRIREGYGLTECVTASCLTPYHIEKEGSIGLPFPDTYYKIVRVGGTEALPPGEIGEICISGPTVMLGYDDMPEETANTLRVHPDGRVWLHTGDLGSMDEDGFVYFKQRIKRVIISSGYTIYPSQLENVIDSFKGVKMSCVIGVPDPYRMQRPKAFVVLEEGVKPTEEFKKALVEHCRRNIARYAMPKEFEFRDSLPKTGVGKIAYTQLEAEEAAKLKSSN